MAIATNIVLGALIYMGVLWILVRLSGGADDRNSPRLAAAWGFLLSLVCTIGGASLAPFPLLVVFSALTYYYDLGIGRALGTIIVLGSLAYGLQYSLIPLVTLLFE